MSYSFWHPQPWRPGALAPLATPLPTGHLTLPGEDWSPPGKRPRNSYMTNLDGLCQGGPEGEKYPKTTRTGNLVKRPKNKQKGNLEESCESLIFRTDH